MTSIPVPFDRRPIVRLSCLVLLLNPLGGLLAADSPTGLWKVTAPSSDSSDGSRTTIVITESNGVFTGRLHQINYARTVYSNYTTNIVVLRFTSAGENQFRGQMAVVSPKTFNYSMLPIDLTFRGHELLIPADQAFPGEKQNGTFRLTRLSQSAPKNPSLIAEPTRPPTSHQPTESRVESSGQPSGRPVPATVLVNTTGTPRGFKEKVTFPASTSDRKAVLVLTMSTKARNFETYEALVKSGVLLQIEQAYPRLKGLRASHANAPNQKVKRQLMKQITSIQSPLIKASPGQAKAMARQILNTGFLYPLLATRVGDQQAGHSVQLGQGKQTVELNIPAHATTIELEIYGPMMTNSSAKVSLQIDQ